MASMAMTLASASLPSSSARSTSAASGVSCTSATAAVARTAGDGSPSRAPSPRSSSRIGHVGDDARGVRAQPAATARHRAPHHRLRFVAHARLVLQRRAASGHRENDAGKSTHEPSIRASARKGLCARNEARYSAPHCGVDVVERRRACAAPTSDRRRSDRRGRCPCVGSNCGHDRPRIVDLDVAQDARHARRRGDAADDEHVAVVHERRGVAVARHLQRLARRRQRRRRREERRLRRRAAEVGAAVVAVVAACRVTVGAPPVTSTRPRPRSTALSQPAGR